MSEPLFPPGMFDRPPRPDAWQLQSLILDGWILVYLVRGDGDERSVILGQPVLVDPTGEAA